METTMATLPGLPDPDDSESGTLPVEPEFAPQMPLQPADPEHELPDPANRPEAHAVAPGEPP